jgi:hypothetical protein
MPYFAAEEHFIAAALRLGSETTRIHCFVGCFKPSFNAALLNHKSLEGY